MNINFSGNHLVNPDMVSRNDLEAINTIASQDVPKYTPPKDDEGNYILNEALVTSYSLAPTQPHIIDSSRLRKAHENILDKSILKQFKLLAESLGVSLSKIYHFTSNSAPTQKDYQEAQDKFNATEEL